MSSSPLDSSGPASGTCKPLADQVGTSACAPVATGIVTDRIAEAKQSASIRLEFGKIYDRWKASGTKLEQDLYEQEAIFVKAIALERLNTWDHDKRRKMIDKHIRANIRIAGLRPETWVRLWLVRSEEENLEEEQERLADASISFADAIDTALAIMMEIDCFEISP